MQHLQLKRVRVRQRRPLPACVSTRFAKTRRKLDAIAWTMGRLCALPVGLAAAQMMLEQLRDAWTELRGLPRLAEPKQS
jgi:hypothetical protein